MEHLLDDLLCRYHLPERWAERLWSRRELPDWLARLLSSTPAGVVWRAYRAGGSTWLALANVAPGAGSESLVIELHSACPGPTSGRDTAHLTRWRLRSTGGWDLLGRRSARIHRGSASPVPTSSRPGAILEVVAPPAMAG